MTAKERKERPVYSGVLRYFPKAMLELARVSYVGNEQHNPGEPLRWDRSKSTDEADALVRHLLQAGEMDTDGLRHTAKAAWRGLALLEKELERSPLAAAVSSGHANHPPTGRDEWSATSLPRISHDERMTEAQPCPNGCGNLTYPAGPCVGCQRIKVARKLPGPVAKRKKMAWYLKPR
jgi:hypothetical protein